MLAANIRLQAVDTGSTGKGSGTSALVNTHKEQTGGEPVSRHTFPP